MFSHFVGQTFHPTEMDFLVLKVNFHHHRENCKLLCTKSCHESMHQISEEVSNIELDLHLVGSGLPNLPQFKYVHKYSIGLGLKKEVTK